MEFLRPLLERQRANQGFDTAKTYGKTRWLWTLLAPHRIFCESHTPSAIFNLVVFPIELIVGAIAIDMRAKMVPSDAAGYGTHAVWLMDISSFTWLCIVVKSAITLGFSYVHATASHSALKNTEVGITPLAKLAWFCTAFSLPSALIEMVLYAVFAASHPTHPTLTAFFALNTTVVLIEIIFFATHYLVEHWVWVVLVGYLYAIPIALVHYMQCDWDDKRPYVYAVVNWAQPLDTMVHILTLTFAAFFTCLGLGLVCQAKNGGVLDSVYIQEPESPLQDAERVTLQVPPS